METQKTKITNTRWFFLLVTAFVVTTCYLIWTYVVQGGKDTKIAPTINGTTGQGFGYGERPQMRSGKMPEFGSGERPQIGSGQMPEFGSGERPQMPVNQQ